MEYPRRKSHTTNLELPFLDVQEKQVEKEEKTLL